MVIEKQITLENKYGLHARPATKIVEIANKFRSEIKVIFEGMEVNAKSVINLLMLGAEKGSKLIIRATGEDADKAVSAIVDLIKNKFDEEEDE